MRTAERRSHDYPVVVARALNEGARRYRSRIVVTYVAVFTVVVLVLGALVVGRAALASPPADPAETSAEKAAESITLSPESMAMIPGETRTFTATAVFDDNSREVLSGGTWSSSSPGVAVTDGQGRITAVAPGTAVITVESGEHRGTATVTVTNDVTQVRISPASLELVVGEQGAFTAEVTLSDGTVQPATAEVDWESDDSSIAAVDNAGQIDALSPGTAVIRATQGEREATAVVTVTRRETPQPQVTLTEIRIEPTAITLDFGGTQQLTLVGAYSDGTTKPLSGSGTWRSGNPEIAAVDDAGLVTANAKRPGEAEVTAMLDGFVSPPATVTVAAKLIDIVINPQQALLQPPAAEAPGDTVQLTATGIYSDGSEVTLTDAAWASDTDAATVDSQGLVTAVRSGVARISASQAGITSPRPAVITVEFSEP